MNIEKKEKIDRKTEMTCLTIRHKEKEEERTKKLAKARN